MLGAEKPFQVVQMGASVNDLVQAAALAAYEGPLTGHSLIGQAGRSARRARTPQPANLEIFLRDERGHVFLRAGADMRDHLAGGQACDLA